MLLSICSTKMSGMAHEFEGEVDACQHQARPPPKPREAIDFASSSRLWTDLYNCTSSIFVTVGIWHQHIRTHSMHELNIGGRQFWTAPEPIRGFYGTCHWCRTQGALEFRLDDCSGSWSNSGYFSGSQECGAQWSSHIKLLRNSCACVKRSLCSPLCLVTSLAIAFFSYLVPAAACMFSLYTSSSRHFLIAPYNRLFMPKQVEELSRSKLLFHF